MSELLQRLFGLQGKRALVTGASSGLGAAFARALAGAGADVALMARRLERLEELAQELTASGTRCLTLQADVTQAAQRTAALDKLEQAWGGVDILVNNAGIADLAPPEDLSAENWSRVVDVNLTAVFHIAQAVGRSMIAHQQGGRIVNTASVAGHAGNSIFPTTAYTASKFGVEGLTKQLAVEWAPHGITVNTITPGWFPTEMNVDPRHGDIHPRHKERMLGRIPMGRLGTTDELIGALLYLVSPGAGYTTGTTVVVDGGWLAW